MVTGVGSLLSVEADGIPQHIADVRSMPVEEHASALAIGESEEEGAEPDGEVTIREDDRPVRVRQAPGWLNDFVT